MNDFLNAISNLGYTENGALTHVSTKNPLLDMFFHGAAIRKTRPDAIVEMFREAFKYNPTDALRLLFYLRDIRGGQGERLIFRKALADLAAYEPYWFTPHNLLLIVEYGRWDDVVQLVNVPQVKDEVVKLLALQYQADLGAIRMGSAPTLLGKWLPSQNTSSKKTKDLANILINSDRFGTARQYRKNLTALRAAIKIVETKLSAREFTSIDYSKLPSKAAVKYRKAFWRNDPDGYGLYIKALEKGETKINAGTLYPVDIIKPYLSGYGVRAGDPTLEAAWKALPDYVNNLQGLVIADVSDSMHGEPLQVCLSLALYIAERNKNEAFRNRFVTFSSQPKLVELKGDTIYSRLCGIDMNDWGQNTDFQAVFNLVLDRAQACNVPAADMPRMLLVISDMEFDQANGGGGMWGQCRAQVMTNLEVVRQRYQAAGYKLPKLVFWNVRSAQKQTPATQNDMGVYLVSGYSPSILKFVLNLADGKDMTDLMYDVIHSERYLPIKWEEEKYVHMDFGNGHVLTSNLGRMDEEKWAHFKDNYGPK